MTEAAINHPRGRSKLLETVAAMLLMLVILAGMVPVLGISLLISQIAIISALFVIYRIDGGFSRKDRNPYARTLVSLLTVILTIRYLSWRFNDTMPYGYGWIDVFLAFLLLAAEGHGMISSLLGQIINAMPLQRRPPALPDDPENLPRVDVLVPTYNEDPSIVETTVIAATQMRYPADRLTVYILDDGGTDAKCAQPGAAGLAARERATTLKNIATRFGAQYLTRARNEHAKAGNLNSALSSINGDLILVLDCDHVPTEDFLRRTVGFFLNDPRLFLLQTPHNFVTADPIERNLRTFRNMPSENELFYSVMQPGLDFWGAAFFCGSAAVMRRVTLDEIGGISGRTITEDAETSVKALTAGWRTAFYNRPMVSGLQPETFSGFILQRIRWAQGMVQIFILENVWLKPGLRFMQRLMFTNFAFYWLFPIARMILLTMPPAFLFFGINVAVTTPRELLIFAAPYYVATLINSQYFYGKVRWPFFSQVYETAQSIFLAFGVFSVIRHPNRPTFKVTPKGEFLEEDFVSSLIWPFYIITLVNFVSVIFGAWRLLTEPNLRDALLLVGLWVFLDTITLMNVIGALSERKQTRSTPRAVRREPVWIRINTGPWHTTKTYDLSRHGASVLTPPDLPPFKVGDYIEVFFRRRGMSLLGRVRNTKGTGASRRIGLVYELESAADERYAVMLAFGDSAAIVSRVNRRHGGLSAARAFAFLVQVGTINFSRFIWLSTRLIRVRVIRKFSGRRRKTPDRLKADNQLTSVNRQQITPQIPID